MIPIVAVMKRSANNASLDGEAQEDSGSYSYGLFKLPPNCEIIKIDVDGHNSLQNVRMDDRILVSSCIETAVKYITQSQQQISDECDIIIRSNKETMGEVTLVEYSVLLRFHIDTIVGAKHIALIQNVNPLRCACGDSVQIFCDTTDKQAMKTCVQLTISSYANPVRLVDSVLMHQHFTTLVATSDQDDFSSKNPLDEVSINRKRAKKGGIVYNKICESTTSKK